MFESRYPFEPTAFAMTTPALDAAYDEAWDGIREGPHPGRALPSEAGNPGERQEAMKLASLKGPTRDGTLVVVERRPLHGRDRFRHLAPTMQHALENWDAV